MKIFTGELLDQDGVTTAQLIKRRNVSICLDTSDAHSIGIINMLTFITHGV